MTPYLSFHRDVTDEHFKRLAGQLKPLGVLVFVYHWCEHMRHLETWSHKGFYMGPGSGTRLDRILNITAKKPTPWGDN